MKYALKLGTLARGCAAALVAIATLTGPGAQALASTANATPVLAAVTDDARIRHDDGIGAGTLAGLMLATAAGPALAAQPDRAGTTVTVCLVDAETNAGVPQGDATLAGATVVAKDASGTVAATATTDATGRALLAGLGTGTYTITQTRACAGYARNTRWSASVEVLSDGTIRTADALDCPVTVLRSRALFAKVDADTGEATAQGDATLAGAVVEVVNRSTRPVFANGSTHAPGEVVCTATTGGDGEALTAEGLPLGSYEARERSASEGYGTDATWSQAIEVSRTQIVYDLTASGKVRPKGYEAVQGAQPMREPVLRGGVRVRKADAEGGSTARGAATLAGATFEVVSQNDAPVVVSGVAHARGDVVATVTTDARGVAETAADLLPFGTYLVHEAAAPAGYLRDEGWSRTFQVREGGAVVDLTGAGDDACRDHVMRGDLALAKVLDDPSHPLAGVAFLVTSATTGEAHVVVTDAQGRIDTSASAHPHAHDTNASDAALGADDTVDESLLDPAAGTWFSGSATIASDPDDARGALPYDTYTVSELRTSITAGHRLQSVTVTIDSDGRVADAGTVTDTVVEGVSTRLALHRASLHQAAGDGDGNQSSIVSLTDDVELTHLVRGRTYTLSGSLHVRGADGSDQGPLVVGGHEVTATETFRAEAPTQTVSVAFALDVTGLEGTTLVCFEELSSEVDGVVATHADIADDDQAVRIPGISTTLADANGSHEVMAVEGLELRDTVAYAGLEPGAPYRLVATLADRETGEMISDPAGSPYRFSHDFTAQAERGTETVPIVVDASSLAGRSVVCLESLERDGDVVAEHADLADAAQTVTVPSIGTTATVKGGSGKTAPASANVTIADTVTYANLVPGQAYELTGTLVDTGTGRPVADPVTVQLTPESADGTATVEIPVDASSLSGRTLVCLETLTRASDGAAVATHADEHDAAQTVRVAGLSTTATDGASGTHSMNASDGATVTDLVAWRGVTPGERVTVEGTLMDRETGEPVTGSDGQPVTATTTVTAERSTGSVELEFHLDASALAGRTLVCYERLLDAGGNAIASHEDLTDEAQSVRVGAIATTLVDGATADHIAPAQGTRTLTDTISYRNLVPGQAYEVTGTLHDRATGETIADSNGDAVTATAELTPAEPDGTVTVTFGLDCSALAGRTVVAFEELSVEGVTVATHADLADDAQSVCFPSLATTATVEGTESHMATADGDPVRIADVVEYANLLPGREYRLEGALVDQESGRAIKDNGSEVTAAATLTPETPDGSVTVTFEVRGTKALAGRTTVAFERLYLGDTLVAEHADARDAAQSVSFVTPEEVGIDTVLHVTGSDSHEVASAHRVSLTDTIGYAGLEPGRAYSVRGILYDRATGEPALVAASEDTSDTKAGGTTTATATSALDALPASTPVWVESGRTWHADLGCGAIVDLPSLRRTTAGAARAAGMAACDREARANGTDTTNATGTNATPQTATPAEGRLIAATYSLVPDAPMGTAEVTYEFDASALAGRELVAFEEVRDEDGTLVASHTDIDDADQTVRVSTVATETGTSAKSAGTNPTNTTGAAGLAGTGDRTEPLIVCGAVTALAAAGMGLVWRGVQSRRTSEDEHTVDE